MWYIYIPKAFDTHVPCVPVKRWPAGLHRVHRYHLPNAIVWGATSAACARAEALNPGCSIAALLACISNGSLVQTPSLTLCMLAGIKPKRGMGRRGPLLGAGLRWSYEVVPLCWCVNTYAPTRAHACAHTDAWVGEAKVWLEQPMQRVQGVSHSGVRPMPHAAIAYAL